MLNHSRRSLLVFALLVGCAESAPPEPPEAAGTPAEPAAAGAAAAVCPDRSPLRNAYFGELHIHTALSMDAFAFGTRATPEDAYRYARGEPIEFVGSRRARLERPLDFAAVTDHASYMGEMSLCTRSGSPVYDSRRCRIYRDEEPEGEDVSMLNRRWGALMPEGASAAARSAELCGEDFELCRAEMQTVWEATQAATERADDPCGFTAFHGYEYTATPDLTKIHRNVVFRNASVPARPAAWVDEPTAWDLWERLAEDCLNAGIGCDVLTIPHNSNMSSGRMFALGFLGLPLEEQIERARLRARLEPLVEILQNKGDSECRNGMWKVMGGRDEQCDFEKIRALEPPPEDCRDGVGQGGLVRQGCLSRLDFVRYVLVEGLREAERIGVNPLKLGITASTDAHNGNPGDVEEVSFDGFAGNIDASPVLRLTEDILVIGVAGRNAGGLVGVWAEQNTRDALFDGMQRRETFGTSGPRIRPRLFAGWSYPEDLCGAADLLDQAYAGGVPMGGDLPPKPEGAEAPRFLVSALRDPGAEELPSYGLQRIQIIKGWPGPDGEIHQQVVDVAGSAGDATELDLETCEVSDPGHATLCAVWSDPEFDPEQSAVYYARVLERPSCRWSRLQCNALPEADRPPACADPEVPDAIQERAWTSPIWYQPPAS